ncbi:MAG: hypothetical protein ACRCST_06910 [Turicibacter sp.]
MVVNYIRVKRAAHLLFIIVLFELLLLNRQGFLSLNGNKVYVVCATVYLIVIFVIYRLERRAKKRFKTGVK